MQSTSRQAELSALSSHAIIQLPSQPEYYICCLLKALGEQPMRPGLVDTPRRVWESLSFLTDGYGKDIRNVIGDAIFPEQYDQMVFVRDIEFYSLCEHHMLPFFGRAHVAYIPDGRIIGLSKLPRLIDVYSHRLQVQERLTTQIADGLMEVLEPKGAAVVMEASHLCMMMRGVQKQHSQTVTSAMRGLFKTDQRTRAEFLELLKR
jgi:GTP cyclohydrolase I